MLIALAELLLKAVFVLILAAAVFSYVRMWHERLRAKYYIVTEHGCIVAGQYTLRRMQRRNLVKFWQEL